MNTQTLKDRIVLLLINGMSTEAANRTAAPNCLAKWPKRWRDNSRI